jgi:hypothetical protein
MDIKKDERDTGKKKKGHKRRNKGKKEASSQAENRLTKG